MLTTEEQVSPGQESWAQIDVDTPALVVDVDRFTNNLREMHEIAAHNGIELVPHAKTHRMAQAGSLQAQYSDGLCVAKLGEAEQFARAGITRMFVAFPLAGEAKMRRALALHEELDITFAIDGELAARALGACFAEAGQTAKVMITIDSGLGRDGVGFAAAPALADIVGRVAGLDLVGIYTHEGSVYAASDKADLQRRSVDVAEAMVRTAEAIRAQGHALPIVSMGASASARLVAQVPGVTQIRPGIYAFNDAGQVALENATLDTCAARVIATVVSHPEPGRACIDAGSKSLSPDLLPASSHRDEFPGHGIVVNAPGWQIERLSEEHGWLRWHGEGEPTELPVSTRLEIIPNHVCMVFAMLRRATIIQQGQIIDVWDAMGPGTSE